MSTQALNDGLYISGDMSRLFLNLELGCSSSCSYCYLPSEGMQQGKRPLSNLSRSPAEILAQLQEDPRFVSGRQGTILSIGCFSECWDLATRPKTIELIQGLLQFDNWIQFATKRQIRCSDLKKITSQDGWRGQVVAYISTATLSRWREFERGTVPPEFRFRSFATCATLGVRSCLYIKPVLPDITLQDLKLYGSVMQNYGVDAVVGDLFVQRDSRDSSLAPISQRLYISENSGVPKMREALRHYGQVFNNSTLHLCAV